MVKNWAKKTPDNFRFTVKFPKVITHDKHLVEITTISPWVQAYVLDGRLGFSARWVHAADDIGTQADGYVLRADLAVTPSINVFGGYADAPEISDGTLVPTRTVFGGVSWDVTDPLTLRASLAHEQRPTFDRTIFGLGMTTRF